MTGKRRERIFTLGLGDVSMLPKGCTSCRHILFSFHASSHRRRPQSWNVGHGLLAHSCKAPSRPKLLCPRTARMQNP